MNLYITLHLKESETALNTFLNKNAWDFLPVSEQKGFARH